MNMKTVKITAIVILVVFLFSIIGSGLYYVFAESDQQIVNNSKKTQQEKKQAIAEITDKKYAALNVLNQLTEQVNGLQVQINGLDTTLNNYYTEIDLMNQEIDKATVRINNQDEILRKRLRAMNENGNVGMLDIILSATSFADLLERLDAVKTITNYDQTILQRYESAKKEVQDKKSAVQTKMAEVENTKNQIVSKQSEIQVVQNKKQSEVDSLSNLISQYEADLAASKQAEEEANERIRQAVAEAAAKSATSTTPTYHFTSGALNYPFASHYVVTSPFGGRISPISGRWEGHSGVDLGAPYGTPILASSDGVVITAGYNTGGYGNYVVIDHGGGIYTLYAHASALCVSTGDAVTAGQHIANVGSTGWSTGPHLHFEVRVNGTCVDPSGYVPVY